MKAIRIFQRPGGGHPGTMHRLRQLCQGLQPGRQSVHRFQGAGQDLCSRETSRFTQSSLRASLLNLRKSATGKSWSG
ncbi:MAG: hypothetical protein MZV64_50250 [Ignavibacteriales bacterium]|nr:hypothetical protein [Ignavibacteriales bacterium]